MLIYDAADKNTYQGEGGLLDIYLKRTMDERDPEFEDDLHPRAKKGDKGGQFIKSNKTITKEDDISSVTPIEKVRLPSGKSIPKSFAEFLHKNEKGDYVDHKESPFLRKQKGDGRISSQLDAILDRLFGGKDVTDEEIAETPEWKEAIEREQALLAELQSTYGVSQTSDIKTPERNFIRNAIMEAALSPVITKNVEVEGIEGLKFETNEGLQDGESYKVEQGKKVFITIGFPAAGKSTTFANPLAKKYKARLCDSDSIKKVLPEFANGYGGNVVHQESTDLNEAVISKATDRGDNIVYPILGYKEDKLRNAMQYFKNKGYSVSLCFKDMPKHIAKARLLVRFLQKGRYLPLHCISKVGNKLPQAFNGVKKESDAFVRTTNENPYGGNDTIIEQKGGIL